MLCSFHLLIRHTSIYPKIIMKALVSTFPQRVSFELCFSYKSFQGKGKPEDKIYISSMRIKKKKKKKINFLNCLQEKFLKFW